ncbi:hypothetical protein JMG10_08680 [Nostoc ellipsosporum NOK]|nr:hypothetical protein [Nostoc ellipsosporum NOK]
MLTKKADKGSLLSLVILWSGGALIFIVMASFWAPVNEQSTKGSIRADGEVFVDQLLLTYSDLNLPNKTSLINTLRKDIGEMETGATPGSADDRKKLYNRLFEQRVRKASTPAPANDGWRVGAIP